ncbi:carbohydrate esterase family 12 protein [Aureobasidium subglaciale EXF-2481]|uniref:Carbohydrate esterase family 12 protein n=1 Tax=Aureobasidium subglaciale (strain EXF-2481) TaxID=1043005 RepID=A0A074ZDB2_AURSE|nr:carbohydrate esterase family 12 protein [Aureobasidium subglaciale EXF-2481]KAI5201019.1 SGNH hydrolase [Aureobasidium subglaciale]KAI5219737.1 SGNH hydrolase [Aureobasidium subglaciale]KAI5223418.1 SGNH hydrolase [Aureobasidium subglaciale]KAI5260413.1 SGNH hydrolase [Aureobasidium subglaciale]KEQ96656.1 carbohydrate esterase family 12 protein [Aureobasidium subglaciale EXF-2481]
MLNAILPLALCLVGQVAGQTVYLAGDSTTAPGGGGKGTEGWGQYLHYSMKIPVVNKAFAGRSARSFTREGRFDDIGKLLTKGDFVVIEFGHNDGSSSPDNGRSDCPGSGTETCQYTYNGVTETVHTFPYYLEQAAKSYVAKGAHVIISSQTPNNPDESGVFVGTPPRFVALAKTAATNAKVDYVDHSAYSYAAYKPLPVSTVNSYFPNDHTHTAPKGADLVAQAFVRGLVCGGSLLSNYVKNATSSIEGSCL